MWWADRATAIAQSTKSLVAFRVIPHDEESPSWSVKMFRLGIIRRAGNSATEWLWTSWPRNLACSTSRHIQHREGLGRRDLVTCAAMPRARWLARATQCQLADCQPRRMGRIGGWRMRSADRAPDRLYFFASFFVARFGQAVSLAQPAA